MFKSMQATCETHRTSRDRIRLMYSGDLTGIKELRVSKAHPRSMPWQRTDVFALQIIADGTNFTAFAIYDSPDLSNHKHCNIENITSKHMSSMLKESCRTPRTPRSCFAMRSAVKVSPLLHIPFELRKCGDPSRRVAPPRGEKYFKLASGHFPLQPTVLPLFFIP